MGKRGADMRILEVWRPNNSEEEGHRRGNYDVLGFVLSHGNFAFEFACKTVWLLHTGKTDARENSEKPDRVGG